MIWSTYGFSISDWLGPIDAIYAALYFGDQARFAHDQISLGDVGILRGEDYLDIRAKLIPA